jgi:hypothetical protein
VSTDTLDRDFPETADRLRRTLAAVAGSTPTPDRSAELAARLAAGGHRDGVADFGLAAARRRRGRRRLLVVAAAAVAVLAIGAALAARAGRDEPGAFTTNPDVGTGWFLPPEGWTVTGVDSDFLDVGESGACPCTTWVAARPGDDGAAVLLFESAAPATPEAGGDPIDVGGRAGRVDAGGTATFVTASGGGRRVIVTGRNVGREDLAALADGALDQREAGADLAVGRLPLPAGFVPTVPVVKPAWRSENLVAVHVREDATGRRLTYQVVPGGYLRDGLLVTPSLRVTDGVVTGTGVDPETEAPMLVLVGGSEDVQVGGTAFGEPVDRFTTAELRRFAAGLREVETAEWRAALDRATGPVEDEVRRAETLTSPPLVER